MSDDFVWGHCISHCNGEVDRFIEAYFPEARSTLIIAGAGFDPRSYHFCTKLSETCKGRRLSGIFIREERVNPLSELLQAADENTKRMTMLIPGNTVSKVHIFASDGAVIGGREVVRLLKNLQLKDFSDIVVDVSSLSLGIYFPMIRYLHDMMGKSSSACNLHIVLKNSHSIDSRIRSIASDRVELVHGYDGDFNLDVAAGRIRLWLPQLIEGKRAVLDKIFSYVNPQDICPVLPFPAAHPRLPDQLIRHYAPQIESTWQVDSRDIIYADDDDPLDFYRTVLRLAGERDRVFQEVGGSMVVLSPIGTKASAVGALMAAIERNFPVAYVEADSYTVDEGISGEAIMSSHHIWLCGNIYDDGQGR